MATEKFIHGKRDSCKHDGLYSIRKREQQAEDHLKNWEEEILPIEPQEMLQGQQYNVRKVKHHNVDIIMPKNDAS